MLESLDLVKSPPENAGEEKVVIGNWFASAWLFPHKCKSLEYKGSEHVDLLTKYAHVYL